MCDILQCSGQNDRLIMPYDVLPYQKTVPCPVFICKISQDLRMAANGKLGNHSIRMTII